MKQFDIKLLSVILIIVCIFGSVNVTANDITARFSNQSVYVDAVKVENIKMYNINDNNYVRLRDIAKAVDFYVFYDETTDSVHIDRSKGYEGGDSEVLPNPGDNVTAVPSSQNFIVKDRLVRLTAYNILDNNYIKLRDIGGVINLGMAYDPATDCVYIDRQTAYLQNMPPELLRPEAIPQQVVTSVPSNTDRAQITEKILDGSEWAWEDYSQQANPTVFDDVFTCAAYNAIRQSIVDRDTILADNNENGYNLYYRYANFIDRNYTTSKPGETYSAMNKVMYKFNGYYMYELGIEPYVKNRYDYWGYRVCKAITHDFYATANEATAEFINEIEVLSSDRDKVKRINDYVCKHIDYGHNTGTSVNKIFTSSVPVLGLCGDYADAFNYLCQLAGIPDVLVSSETHGWNEVYVDGRWYVVDTTTNDVDAPDYDVIFLWETHPTYADKSPKHTAFAKELLVPSGSTK